MKDAVREAATGRVPCRHNRTAGKACSGHCRQLYVLERHPKQALGHDITWCQSKAATYLCCEEDGMAGKQMSLFWGPAGGLAVGFSSPEPSDARSMTEAAATSGSR